MKQFNIYSSLKFSPKLMFCLAMFMCCISALRKGYTGL